MIHKIKFYNEPLNEPLNGTLNDTLKSMLEVIDINNHITQQELAETIGVSLRTIKRNIEYLKKNGCIERVGSKKSGYWKIL